MGRARLVVPGLVALLVAGGAHALDKQGSGAHGGSVAGAESGVDLTGALSAGLALYNPSYAARPDNSGLALARYALHADLDLVGRRLSIPVDVNVFTDREREGFAVLAPTELDVITGVTSTWALGARQAFEASARIEHDRPLDRGGVAQTYADLRGRLLGEASLAPLGSPDRDVSGWLTVGLFVFNPARSGTYFARPDNSGRALLRYAAHGSVELVPDLVTLAVDATFFTDREASAPLRPSELDLTPEIIVSGGTTELHLAYERDMPLDRAGLSQQFVYVLVQRAFDLIDDPEPFTPLRRATPASP